MSLLLRVSIVFVALVYLGQLRRKQHFIRSVWLSPSSLLNHPAFRSSTTMTTSQTAQLIRDFLTNQSGQDVGSTNLITGSSAVSGAGAYKTDDELMNEYQDLPPNYEEALQCPLPNGFIPTTTSSTNTFTNISSSSSLSTYTSLAISQHKPVHHPNRVITPLRPISPSTSFISSDTCFVTLPSNNNNNNNTQHQILGTLLQPPSFEEVQISSDSSTNSDPKLIQ